VLPPVPQAPAVVSVLTTSGTALLAFSPMRKNWLAVAGTRAVHLRRNCS